MEIHSPKHKIHDCVFTMFGKKNPQSTAALIEYEKEKNIPTQLWLSKCFCKNVVHSVTTQVIPNMSAAAKTS